ADLERDPLVELPGLEERDGDDDQTDDVRESSEDRNDRGEEQKGKESEDEDTDADMLDLHPGRGRSRAWGRGGRPGLYRDTAVRERRRVARCGHAVRGDARRIGCDSLGAKLLDRERDVGGDDGEIRQNDRQ